MKLTFRATLLTILATLLFLTVAALGYNSHRNARFIATDLSDQILEQTCWRVDHQLNSLLHVAKSQGVLDRRLMFTGQLPADDFGKLAAHWVEVMKAHPKLTFLALGLEAEGVELSVRRQVTGQLVLGERRRNDQTGRWEHRDYRPASYPAKAFLTNRNHPKGDPRTQPWYIAAKEAGRQTWPDTYVLPGNDRRRPVPGVTCATPLFRRDGNLLGVLGAGFDLRELCQFLKNLHPSQRGYAFVVEVRADGARRLIAHPDPAMLLRGVAPDFRGLQEIGRPHSELVPVEEVADPRVGAFLSQVPAKVNPLDVEDHMVPVSFTAEGVAYLGAYRCLSTRETPDWLICVVIPESDVLGRVDENNRRTLLLGLLILVAAVLIGWYIAAQVSRPLENVVGEMAAVGRLEIDPHPAARSLVQEVDHLALAVEDMKTSLRSFRKYVPAELVRSLVASNQEARLGGERREVTILFCDIADFTAIAETLPPESLVEQLGECLGALSLQVIAAGGTVDKYIGDAVMAFWGAPARRPGHALAACTAAVRCRAKLVELRRQWEAEGKPLFFARTGLHTGPVVVGNIGSEERMNYTVIGDAVNLASRLEGLNKVYGTDLLISECTYQEAAAGVVARPLDWVLAKGKKEAVRVYELLGLREEVGPVVVELAEVHEQALARYRRQDWRGATALFEQVLRLQPGDGPATVMIGRCRQYQAEPPGADWDGVFRVLSK